MRDEALEVQRILERFRFHQAPERLADASGFFVPPSPSLKLNSTTVVEKIITYHKLQHVFLQQLILTMHQTVGPHMKFLVKIIHD
jgi:hypothetical protein